MRVDRLPGGDLELNWSPSCVGADVDYAIYEGSLGEFATHDAETCSTGSATTWTLTSGAGSRYFLVVPQSPNREGGYGADSAGNPRTQSASACQPQYLAVCD